MGGNLWFVGVFATFALFITIETTSSDLGFGKENFKKLNAIDPVEKAAKRYKHDSVEEKGALEIEEQRIVDDTIENANVSRDISRNGYKVAKKNYKKLKLAQIQTGYSDAKNKGRSSDRNLVEAMDLPEKVIERRNANYTGDREASVYNKEFMQSRKQYANDLARRQILIDQLRARQRMMFEQYEKEKSTTPKYSDHDLKNRANNNKSSNVKRENKIVYGTNGTNNQMSVEKNGEDYEYYEYESEEEEDTVRTTEAIVVTMTPIPKKLDATQWGKCDRDIGRLLYQHNVVLSIVKGATTETNVGISVDDFYSVTCVKVSPPAESEIIATFEVARGENDVIENVKIIVNGLEDGELTFSIKVWVARKNSNHCRGGC
ncbi:uncharacterized protein LOC122399887 [Colletes gigas]|uniref:uncharacterized protein LOC122399887 n=1 Tax=Colletes gigas TaxID=935657 RepID=UPI001C9A38D1|nr:uncharacterized protein LOC122399887 [Colletes gigas]